MTRAIFLIGMSAVVFAGAALADQWPAWRGPRGDGTSEEKNIPVRWSATENIAWRTAIPGKGHSSPVVWGDRIFVTTCNERTRQRTLLAIDRTTGKILWQRVVLTAPREVKNSLNSYASSTPATDGKHVWVTFLAAPKVHIVCYDMAGKEVWRHSPGKFSSVHGFCSSLLPYEDLVILNADQDARGKDRAYIVALDKATGKERWRIDRANRIRSYTPPVVFQAAGKPQMVLSGANSVASYDPRNGKQHWIIDGPTDQFVASMVYTDGVFAISGGYPTLHILGIRPDGKGNVTKTHVLWHVRKNPSYVPSPIAAGKYFFLVSDKGTASCLEAKTGKYMWQQKLGRRHSASPVSAGGNLYFLDDKGVTFVVKASPKFELVTKNNLGEDCRASPAISRGQIFIRAVSHLYCIGPSERDIRKAAQKALR
ncbi:MAG: PQQ-binding-like beta-propeller repeat protein [Phycisphaerae bacterium]|nr:PQQ-binding-like beta-propeller repeat protein [Phycisphaerae bacterium]